MNNTCFLIDFSLRLIVSALVPFPRRYLFSFSGYYEIFPLNSITLKPKIATIRSGDFDTKGPFTLTFGNTGALVPGRSYLLPVGIWDEGEVPPHETGGQAYFLITVQLQNINSENPIPLGSRIERILWTATASSNDNEFSPNGSTLDFETG